MPSGILKTIIEKSCIVCKSPFVATNGRSKYCSKVCRNKRNYLEGGKEASKKWQLERAGRFEAGKLQCYLCGWYYVQICSHVVQSHGLTNREYKELIGKDLIKGIIPDWYRKIKQTRNFETKEVAWKNLKKGRLYWYKKGDSNNYERSPETMERLKVLHKYNKRKNHLVDSVATAGILLELSTYGTSE